MLIPASAAFASKSGRFRSAPFLLILCVFFIGTGSAVGQRKPGPPNPQEDFEALNEIAFRNPEDQRILKVVAENLENGNHAIAFPKLQRMLEREDDSFLRNRPPVLHSLREHVEALLGQQSRLVLRDYEQYYGQTAKRLLDEAIAAQDHNGVDVVIRQFLHTRAGLEALRFRALSFVDEGLPHAAVNLLLRPVNARAHGPAIEKDDYRLQLATALRAAGKYKESRSVLEGMNAPDDPRVRGVVDLVTTMAKPHSADFWPLPFGSMEGQRETNVTAPWLKPAWTVNFLQDKSLQKLFNDWSQEAREPASCINAHSAVHAEGKVFVRGLDSIQAFETVSGKQAWEFPCETRLSDLATSKDFARSSQLQKQELLGNGVLGSITTNGQMLFAVDAIRDLYSEDDPPTRTNVIRGGRNVPQPIVPLDQLPPTNRLIALPLNAAGDSGNVKPIWTISGTVELPDWFQQADANKDRVIEPKELNGKTRFQRFDRDGDGILTAAEVRRGMPNDSEFRDHYFLGPPLPVGNRLFVIAENAGRLNCIALDARTGRKIWSQGIGFVYMPLSENPLRGNFVCTPLYRDGIVVCPTNSEMLVALDAADGTLRWSGFHGTQFVSFSRRRRVPNLLGIGLHWFPTAPVIRRNRIFYLPRFSRMLHCFDLYSGERIWSVRREAVSLTQDQYIAAVTDTIVLVAGKSGFRGLDTVDGSEKWRRSFPGVSGRGICLDDAYLVPLPDGEVETMKISTGERVSVTRLSARSNNVLPREWSPGHLMPAGDFVVSLRADRLDVFPQTQALLRRTRAEVAANGNTFASDFLSAELQVAMGNTAAARTELLAISKRVRDAEEREQTHSLLREILYGQLERGADNERAVLDELAQFSKTSPHRARYLMLRSRLELREQNYERLFELTDELEKTAASQPLLLDQEAQHFVTLNAWLAAIYDRLAEIEDANIKANISRRLDGKLAAEDTSLEQFAAICRSWPQGARARSLLAKDALSQGDLQRAEIFLQANAESESCPENFKIEAFAKTIEILTDAKLEGEAVSRLNQLRETYADRISPDELKRLTEYVRQSGCGRIRLKSAQPTTARNSSIEIVGSPSQMPDLRSRQVTPTYRRVVDQPWGRTYRLYAPGSRLDALTVLNNATNLPVAEISAEAQSSFPSRNRGAHAGHYLPIGTTNNVRAISLLDLESNFWDVTLDDFNISYARHHSKFRTGPAGAHFCSFQTNGALFVLNPLNGKLLWARRDILPRTGLITDPATGLFGDDQVLVMLSPDQRDYTVYRTMTGEVLRRGRLSAAPQLGRETFGRHLFCVSDEAGERHFKIWDPLTDEVFDREAFEPRPGSIFSCKLPSGELALVLATGRLVILDVPNGRTLASVPIRDVAWNDVTSMRGFCDHDNYYVAFNVRSPAYSRTRILVSQPRSSPVTTNSLSGYLVGIDRKSKSVWQRDISRRSFLDLPFDRLPFLVSFSYQQDVATRSLETLTVEILDKQTGQTIARKANLFSSKEEKFVRAIYRPDQRRLELYTLSSRVDVNFPRAPVFEDDGAL